jgi:hypothetical protein
MVGTENEPLTARLSPFFGFIHAQPSKAKNDRDLHTELLCTFMYYPE